VASTILLFYVLRFPLKHKPRPWPEYQWHGPNLPSDTADTGIMARHLGSQSYEETNVNQWSPCTGWRGSSPLWHLPADVLQAITLSLRHPCLSKFKSKSSHHHCHPQRDCSLCNVCHWILLSLATEFFPWALIFHTGDLPGCLPSRAHGPLQWFQGDALMEA
jgi:hypothetical protein